MRCTQGFASLSLEERKKMSSKAGKAAHAQGKGHEWNTEEARIAGRLGGLAGAAKRRIEKTNNAN